MTLNLVFEMIFPYLRTCKLVMNIPILIDDDIVRFSTKNLELPTKYIKIERDH